MGIRAHLNDNGHVVAKQRGRWLTRLRRAAADPGSAEERPALSRAALGTDAAIAVVTTIAAVVEAIARIRSEGGSRVFFVVPGSGFVQPVGPPGPAPVSPWILLGVVLTAAPLAFRRTYPITAFCVILAAFIATSRESTAITFASAIFAAYSAVAYSRYRRLALLSVLAAAVVVTAAYPNTSPPVPERFTALLVLLPTVAVGIAIRVWRRRADESAERLRRAQQEHEAETRRAVQEERARIASEMHDVVTHNVAVMVVQAGAARRVLDSSPDDAREALFAVEASGRTAMTELRHLLGLLAPPAAEPGAEPGGLVDDAVLTPQPDLGQIRSLVDRVRGAGLPVELSVEGRRELPSGVDLAAYRVVQEALTNVMKHAGQAKTTIRIQYRPAELLITVCDDGRPGELAPPGGGGRGLIGLRERIAVYGGELDAGPRPGGGWRVTARIPLEPVAGILPVPPEYRGAAT